MRNTITTITLGALLSTGGLYAGGAIAPVEAIDVPILTEVEDPNPFYIGVGLLWADVSRDCICTTHTGEIRYKTRAEDDAWGGIVRVGYDFNQYFGLEARALNASLSGDFFDTTHYGIFLKPMMPIGEQMNIYGLLGYGKTKIEADCGTTIHETFKYDGFSYGIGLEYDLSDKEDDYESYKKNADDVPEFDRPFDGQADQEVNWGLWIDYQNLMNNEGPANFKSNIVSFGVTYDF